MQNLFRAGRMIPLLLIVLGMIVGLTLFVSISPANAEPPTTPPFQKPDNSACMSCHGREGQSTQFPSGEMLGISIDGAVFDESMHANVSCQVCHTNISSYPHPENSAVTVRDYVLQYKDNCTQCHPGITEALQDSVHTKMGDAGNVNAPVCADCHNPHQQRAIQKDANGEPAGSENAAIAQTCARCHNEIYQEYAQSVHGEGVLEDQNPDVPSCTSCHGVHQIADPTTNQFRLSSIDMCADCHTDPERMAPYGLSTEVLNTYVADFHGTTVTLFQKQHPDEPTNKAVCYDCHGVHNIAKVDDPTKGLQIKENMLIACQRCHPDATANFPDSWMSHYIPDKEKTPLVYYVQLFYNILIPTVLGGMALFVATDIGRKVIDRRNKKSKKEDQSAKASEELNNE